MFDFNVAAQKLQAAFLEIKDEVGVSESTIRNLIEPELIASIQAERETGLPIVQGFKEELVAKFPQYRFRARVKSLASILGKAMQNRSLADVFGFTAITTTVDECYEFKEWLVEAFGEYDFDDRIQNPKDNGYRDLKIVIPYKNMLVEFIIQTNDMFVDAHTVQRHELVYAWKYSDVIRSLPVEYQRISF